jgi:hypothetical protein
MSGTLQPSDWEDRMAIISQTDERHRRERDFRVIFLLAYMIFLVGALVGRMLPHRRVAAFAAPRPRSIFAEARGLAYRSLPFAF